MKTTTGTEMKTEMKRKQTVRRVWLPAVSVLAISVIVFAQVDPAGSVYALLIGRPGGQQLIGGRRSGEDLILESTFHATKGDVQVKAGSTFKSTLVEIGNFSAPSLVGRADGGGSGIAEEIDIGTGLLMTGNVLSATGGGGSGHTIRENGTDQTARTGLNFVDSGAGAGLVTDDVGGDETEVNLSLYALISPATTARNVIRPSTTGVVPFTLRQAATATENLIEFRGNSGTPGTLHGFVTVSGTLNLGLGTFSEGPLLGIKPSGGSAIEVRDQLDAGSMFVVSDSTTGAIVSMGDVDGVANGTKIVVDDGPFSKTVTIQAENTVLPTSGITGAGAGSGLDADTVDTLHAVAFPLITPAATARNVIQASATNAVPLTLKNFTGTNQNLMEFRLAANTLRSVITNNGWFRINSTSIISIDDPVLGVGVLSGEKAIQVNSEGTGTDYFVVRDDGGPIVEMGDVGGGFLGTKLLVDDPTQTITIAAANLVLPTSGIIGAGTGSGLDADFIDGASEAAFFKLADAETVTGIPAFNGGTSGATAPFTVDSTFLVTNLNADFLDGISSTGFALATHATAHQSGGADPIKIDDLAAADDNTDLDASTTAHGLLKKLDNDPTHFINSQGVWANPTLATLNVVTTVIFPASNFTTASTSYTNLLDGAGGSPVSVAITKQAAGTSIYCNASISESHTGTNADVMLAVHDGTTAHDIMKFRGLSTGEPTGNSGWKKITGLAAGALTVTLQVKSTAGTFRFTTSNSGSLYCSEMGFSFLGFQVCILLLLAVRWVGKSRLFRHIRGCSVSFLFLFICVSGCGFGPVSVSTSFAGTSTATLRTHLAANESVNVGGIRHIAIVEVFETEPPGLAGAFGADIGALQAGTDYTVSSGVLTVPLGHQGFWARISWTYDDAPTAEDAQTAADETQAASNLITERPQWVALAQDALQKLTSGENQRATDEAASISDKAALVNVTTLAGAKPIIDKMLDREKRRLDREEQLYIWLERIIRALAGLLKIPI